MLLPSEYKELKRLDSGKSLPDEALQRLQKKQYLYSLTDEYGVDAIAGPYHPKITQYGREAMEEFRFASLRPVLRANIALVLSALALIVSAIKLLYGN